MIDRAIPADAEALAQVLVDCVRDGASVGFLDVLTLEQATVWWEVRLRDPDLVVLVERQAGLRGTVTLVCPSYPNQAHRADVSKLLVAPAARRQGAAGRLLRALEQEALARGRWLLVLDTETGSPAQALYAADGWEEVGTIADFAALPDGTLAPTTFMVKRLR